MPLEQWLIIHFKEIFYGKRKKNNALIAFSISHKSGVKIFLKWIVR